MNLRRQQAGQLLAAVLSHAPENAAYGLMAFAPLGAAFGPVAMALALLGAVAANAVATLVGGGRLVGGPRASLALLTAGLVAALLPLWPVGPGGDATGGAWRIAGLVALGVFAAGGLQLLFGLLRLGGIARYTPHPVRVGLSSGIGALLALTAWPVLAGLGFGARHATSPAAWQAGALLVGGSAALAVALAMWRGSRLPPLLLGLGAGIAMHLLLRLLPGSPLASSLGGAVGMPVFPPGLLAGWGAALAAPAPLPLPWRATLDLLAPYALTVAVLCSLDTLLATALVDGRQRRWRDPNRELLAQGLAGMAAALAGAQPASPSVPRSLGIGGAVPPARQAVLGYALLMGVFAAAAPWGFGVLPLAALGGVLFTQGLAMVAPALWRTPFALLRARWRHGAPLSAPGTPAGLLWADWAVALAVGFSAVLLGVGPAVLIGAALAVLLFVRGNIRDVVRSAWHADLRRSLKVRPAESTRLLQQHGGRIVVLELEGALFFGTADSLRARLGTLARSVDRVVLDMRQVREVDGTGARILFELAQDWARPGRQLLIAEWPVGDARRQALQAVAGAAGAGVLVFEDHADRALERAEDALLQQLGVQGTAGVALDLAACALARGLDAQELALLRDAGTVVHFARGSVLFHRGDAADALYLSLAGDIGLQVPGSTRRLASFAAGTSLGEMGVLTGGVRSVDAVAETDVVALRLPADTLTRWQAEQPRMAARLLHNIALHLADRLQLLTGDVARWIERAEVARTTPAADSERGAAELRDERPWASGN